MSKPIVSRKKAAILCFSLFAIGLFLVLFYMEWWPATMLVIGLPLAFYQYLQSRRYDMWITLFVFCGGFIFLQFRKVWQALLVVLFTVGGIYIFFREIIEMRSEVEEEEDLNEEIEEEEAEK